MKKLLLVGLLFVGAFMFCVYARMEAYCFFYPGIDTQYALGFSENAFNQVTNGMTAEAVHQKLGAPLYVQHHAEGETWCYTLDAKCKWGDWAWLGRHVNIRDGKVDEVISRIFYD